MVGANVACFDVNWNSDVTRRTQRNSSGNEEFPPVDLRTVGFVQIMIYANRISVVVFPSFICGERGFLRFWLKEKKQQ